MSEIYTDYSKFPMECRTCGKIFQSEYWLGVPKNGFIDRCEACRNKESEAMEKACAEEKRRTNIEATIGAILFMAPWIYVFILFLIKEISKIF